jgi:hypothetical protein
MSEPLQNPQQLPTAEEIRAAEEYRLPFLALFRGRRAISAMEESDRHRQTLAAAYRREKALRQEAIEALVMATYELDYMYANYHSAARQRTKDDDAETIARLKAVLAKAKEATSEQ